MLKILRNKISVSMVIVAFAVLGSLSMKVEATTAGDIVMNPPALGVVIKGCDTPGAAYSPVTGESCSTKGVAITPPIAFFPPYTSDGCGPVGPYSISTGLMCKGLTPLPPVYTDGCKDATGVSTITGVKCESITPMPPVKIDDCLYNKNCVKGDLVPMPPVYNCEYAKNKECGSIDGTHPIFSSADKMIKKSSSVDDVRAIQAALNKSLKTSLKATLSEDGKWGAKTTEAIKMFQKWAKLKVDGKVGPKTLEKMKASVE